MFATFRKKYLSLKIFLLLGAGFGQLQADYTAGCCPPCGEFFAAADFLYLKAFQGGLEFCHCSHSESIVTDDMITTSFQGNTSTPKFKWNPGFRVAAGYKTANQWKGAIVWTDYRSKTTRHNGEDDRFRWSLRFDTVDGIIAKDFACCSDLTVTPYIGIRGAWIDQKTRSYFADGDIDFVSTGSNSSKFSGFGPLAGLKADWEMGCGWGIYADIALSSLWGKFRVRENELEAYSSEENYENLRINLAACQFVIDSGFGISWSKELCNGSQFIVKIGFEQHRYFDHNQIGRYGDLVLSGGAISAGFNF